MAQIAAAAAAAPVGVPVTPATERFLDPTVPRTFTLTVPGRITATWCSSVALVAPRIAAAAIAGFAVATRRARRFRRGVTFGARAEGESAPENAALNLDLLNFDFVPVLFSADTDSLWPQIISPVLAVSSLSALLVALQVPGLGNASTAELGIVGVLVSFATVFRTQQSYSRFWEGRSKLGMMMAGIVDTASITGVLLESGPCQNDIWRREQKAEVARLLRLYMHEATTFLRSASVATAKRTEYWRNGDSVERDLTEALGSALVKPAEHAEASASEACELDAMAPRTRAPAVLQWLRRALQTAATEERDGGALIAGSDVGSRLSLLSLETTPALGTLQREFGACSKIATTPLPVQYVRIARLLRFVFVFSSPLLVATKLGWSAVLFSGLLAFGYHSVDAVGLALSNPFVGKLGEAALDGRFVTAICTDVNALLLTEPEAVTQTSGAK